jgi:hypothetical protein
MDGLAALMMEAGAEVVVGILKDGQVVMAVADGTPLLEVVRMLREIADSTEREQANYVGHATVEVEE